MPEKLLTLKELSEYLNIPEDDIENLVDAGVIPAYRIGGSFLRFRKEQIDAIRNEIRMKTTGMRPPQKTATVEKTAGKPPETRNSFANSIRDFFYFNDFYILCLVLLFFLLYVIFTM